MKYLGVMIDEKLKFLPHIKYIQEKVSKVTGAICKIMPNLRGPDESKRRLYANVVASIVLYGSPVWSEKINQSKDAQKILREMQKRIALRVVSAYRTVAYDAAIILTRMPPYHLIAEMRGVMYQRAVKSKSDGTWNKEMEKQILHEESARMRFKWRDHSRKERRQRGDLPEKR